MKTDSLIGLAVIGGALWYLKDKLGGPGGVLDNFVASPIADSWLSLTLPGSVNVRGNAILPNGTAVPLNTLYVDDNFQIVVAGRTYTLTGNDGQGNYLAQ